MTTEIHDYTEFDKKLLATLETGCCTASALSTCLGVDAKPLTKRPGEEFRVVDRRLQALRKKGQIVWQRLGGLVVWRITKGDA